MSSDELDWLVYSYLEESGYHHTSFSLLHESSLAGPSTSSAASSAAPSPQPNGRATSSAPGRNPVMDHVVPPGHLIRLLQKGLLYLEAEARYRGVSLRDPPNPPPRLVGYPIPSSLPLPPLPKYVPPPAPPAAPTPTPTPTPPASTAAADPKGKGKAKEPPATPAPAASTSAAPAPAAVSAAPAPKRKAEKAPVAVANAEEPAAEAKRPRATSAETAATAAAGKKGKGKEREREGAVEKEKEREKGGKGKEREKEREKDAEGDVAMEDASSALSTAAPPSAPARTKDAAAPSGKGKERAVPSAPPAAPQVGSTKREREKDDLRPPPAKKSASSAAGAGTSASSSSATANSSAAAATTAGAKRSASPTVARKAKPSSASSAVADAPAPPATPAPAPQNKFRITTTTKTVTTPVPVSAGAAAALAAQQQQRRRGSGDADGAPAAGAGAKKAKPKEEEAPTPGGGLGKNGATGPKSPSKGAASPLKAAGSSGAVVGGKEVDLKGVRVLKCEDKEVIKLKGHTQMKVQPCAFNSKVPSLLATGGADGTCRIWDVPSSAPNPPVVTERMKCKHPSSSRRVDITAVAWDPSGSLLATATEDGIARIWTVSGDLHLVLSMHQRSISAMKWSPGGTMLLTASLDQTVCLWEVSNGKVRQQYSTHSDQVLDVDWNDDGLFASTSSDRMVHLLSTTRPTPLHRFRGHRDDVNVVKFSPCGTLVASCADDTSVRVWSLRNIGPVAREIAAKPTRKGDAARRIDKDAVDGGGAGVWVLEGHGSDVHQVAWHPTAGKEGSEGPRLLASCSFDSTAKLWDADAGTCLYTFARASDFVYSISFEPTLGRYLATGSNDGRLDVWRVKDHALLAEYTHSGEIYELTWHPHGKQLAVCGGTEEVAVVPLLLGPGAAAQ
ncbi:hypothetical protein JCM10449v2_003155 [Rhodotorula kratochvilovae]